MDTFGHSALETSEKYGILSLKKGGMYHGVSRNFGKCSKNNAPNCRVCRECNGIACRGEIPGTGGKGTGSSFTHSYEYLASIKIHMDLLYTDRGQDTSCSFFDKTFAGPVFAAPISGLSNNYNGYLNEKTYAEALVPGTIAAGCAAFTGMARRILFYRPAHRRGSGRRRRCPDHKTLGPGEGPGKNPSGRASRRNGALHGHRLCRAPSPSCRRETGLLEGCRRIESNPRVHQLPFLLKGIMTPEGARKAVETGAYGIVVSNHGGRVLDHTPAPAEMLPAIRDAVGTRVKIFVDGSIRTGVDVFKALALGADAVLIGRPYVVAACGGGAEGVTVYTQKVLAELRDVMKMTGCATLSDITRDKITWNR